MAELKSVTRVFCVLTVCILVLSSLAMVTGTGTNDNQPATGFSEGSETIEIYDGTSDHSTAFDLGETMTIKITTDLVSSLPNQNNNNRVTFWDNRGNRVGNDHKPFFTQTVTGPPHVFEGSVTLDGGNGFAVDTDYLMVVVLREGGMNKMVFSDVIHINGPGTAEQMHFKLFSDAGYTTESYEFPPLSPIYIEVWTGPNATDTASSWAYVSNYQELVVSKQLSQLDNPTMADVGNYTRFTYDLSSDFGSGFPLNDGDWYTLSVRMNDGTNDQVKDWACQFNVNHSLANPPMVTQGDTTADPSVAIVGLDTITISTDFTHADSPSPDAFVVTYKAKDETETEYLLVDQKTNGDGGLIVTQDPMDTTKFTASFDWAPPGGQPTGMYDLNFKVDDGINTAEDVYVNNEDELELRPAPNLPVIAPGSTEALPVTVMRVGTQSTVISVNFSHADGPPADSFKVSFRVRDPGNNHITLVDKAQSGTSGLLVQKLTNTTYKANITWDPADDATPGAYDLYTRIEDGNGAWAEDPYGANAEELTILKEAAPPIVSSGATQVVPAKVNRTGNEMTVISTAFTHADNPPATSFEITYTVKDEGEINYTLVDSKKHGSTNLNVISLGNGSYRATFNWDPPDNQPTGLYDLYFMVKDQNTLTAVDPYGANLDELTISKKPTAPVIAAGVTTAVPSSVNVLGNETTILSAKFFHADIPALTDFKVTYKIRDVGNQEYTILDAKSQGTPGLTISSDGTGNFFANYSWDPPSVGQPLGTYDLFARIVDGTGLSIQDGFNNNLEEMTLYKKAISPGNSTLSGKVTDIKGNPITGATVKVYNSTSGVVVKTLTTISDGTFTVQLPAGIYDIAVQAPEYKGETVSSQQLNEGLPLVIPDFKLLKIEDGTGPPNKVTKEVIPGYMVGLVALLVIIIVIMCLFMLMRASTGTTEPGGGEKKGHHAHEVDKDDVEPDHPIASREKEEIEHEPKAISPKKVKIEKLQDEDEEPGDPE